MNREFLQFAHIGTRGGAFLAFNHLNWIWCRFALIAYLDKKSNRLNRNRLPGIRELTGFFGCSTMLALIAL